MYGVGGSPTVLFFFLPLLPFSCTHVAADILLLLVFPDDAILRLRSDYSYQRTAMRKSMIRRYVQATGSYAPWFERLASFGNCRCNPASAQIVASP